MLAKVTTMTSSFSTQLDARLVAIAGACVIGLAIVAAIVVIWALRRKSQRM